MSRFDGRVAVITGAARGMGKVSALSFAREGAAVALTDILADEVEAVAEEVRAAGGNAVAVPGDVTDPATIDRLVSEAAKLGPVRILHNNAGVFRGAPLEEHTVEDFRRLLDVNCVAQFVAIKRVVPEMRAAGGGAIVNVASIMSWVGLATMPGYAASKAAVLGLTRAIAVEVAPDIRCNAICPGAIDTPMVDDATAGCRTPSARRRATGSAATRSSSGAGCRRRSSRSSSSCASDDASFMTGEIVSVDGGWTAI